MIKLMSKTRKRNPWESDEGFKWQHFSLLYIALGDDVSESGNWAGKWLQGLGKVVRTPDVQKVCSVMNQII